MRRDDRRAAREAKRTNEVPLDAGPIFQPCHCGLMQGVCTCANPGRRPDPHAANDERALRQQVQANLRDPHCGGVY